MYDKTSIAFETNVDSSKTNLIDVIYYKILNLIIYLKNLKVQY